ncbi:hypothetical protein UFOVP434_49 [uncultured Caudovirales phage]|uniref:Uncharacterized protein n=1 Tax=uncultured Caudovirales phage TaxID=2100421 RepID=A0A6J5M774_9CAUD|nr:hypothetical protein UFOVP434_49 [uncultured Caudovirales phage]
MDTLELLEGFFLTKEYRTPEEYQKETGLIAPAFDESKPIKLWSFIPPPEMEGRQLLFDALVDGPDGRPIVDAAGVFLTELILLPRAQAPVVNIPPRDFNFTGKPLIPKINRPFKNGFVKQYDVVRSPMGMSMMARDKQKYEQFLKQKDVGSGSGNPEFEEKVLSYLAAISKRLGV